MKHYLLFLSLFLCITSIHCVKWEDCGIPLTRKIYYQNVVVSPSKLNIVDQSTDRSISINVNVNLQNYKLEKGVDVNLQVLKDGAVFLDSSIGDLCNLLTKANQVSCPLPEGAYSFSYLYQLPPLMTANYTVRIVATEISGAESRQIGCVAATIPVIGLGADACSYKSTLAATFAGTAQYLDNNNVIQVGPYGPGGIDLGYTWGTFVSITASPDLVGYSMRPDNYVWGLRLTQNGTRFTGTMVLGYRPNATALPDAQLVYQGFCDWKMKASPYATFEFEEGTCEFAPTYYFPAGFPYPLNLGNLGVLPITKSGDGYHFSVVASKSWCRCNCNLGGVGRDDTLNGGDSKDDSMSGFRKATIAIAVIGSFILVVAIIVIIKLRRAKPRPVVYDEADLMDPQKPDYGTIAIGEAFEAENQEYN